MNQKEFKISLQRGQGRALQAVRNNPYRYYNLVLWACGKNLSFDTQCEGTRAWYVHQMTNSFEDKTAFVKAAMDGFNNTKLWNDWQMLYLAELLFRLSEDGYTCATNALWDKYEEIYEKLLKMRCSPKRVFDERGRFEMLSLVLAYGETNIIKIAKDVGKLYQNEKVFDGWDFSWLYSAKIKRYKTLLKKQAKKDSDIERYLRVCNNEEQRWANVCNRLPPDRPRTGRALSVWLRRKADEQTVFQYAKEYTESIEPLSRANALSAFCRCPYPDDPQPIIKDTTSPCEELRNSAWEALENIRHAKVREYALNHLEDDNSSIVNILIVNYLPQDEVLLEKIVKQIPLDLTGETGWHSVYLDVLNMADKKIKAPASLLQHIYETSFCSCCRENALRQMVKRRIASTEILKECLLDSNEDIRIYAEKLLKGREKQLH